MVRHAPQITEQEAWEPEDERWTSQGETAPDHLPQASQLQPAMESTSSSLICTKFSDKLNLEIQLNCNQKSKPTGKS